MYRPPHMTCMYPPPQEKVFKTTAEPICQSVMDGYNGTIFACECVCVCQAGVTHTHTHTHMHVCDGRLQRHHLRL